jgi:hypothetical protein
MEFRDDAACRESLSVRRLRTECGPWSRAPVDTELKSHRVGSSHSLSFMLHASSYF